MTSRLPCRKNLYILLFFFLPLFTFGQRANWQNLDLKADSTFGISTEKTYSILLKGKKATKVIVGVLDGGVDVNHEDLKSVIWLNGKEKAENGLDDDKNGYADDMHGWNFLGSAKGSVHYEALELTRLLKRDRKKFKDVAKSSSQDPEGYSNYKAMQADFDKQLEEAKSSLMDAEIFKNVLDKMVKKIGKEKPVASDFQNYSAQTELDRIIISIIVPELQSGTFSDFYKSQVTDAVDEFTQKVKYNLNPDYDPRPSLVGDNYADSRERIYGNADVKGPDASHGTHVAGIIAADRKNTIGIKGVADEVEIMVVRAVPNGDERDKDVANSIRYAVDNGARVLNMSFGKAYSWDKAIVDDAVKYAMSKDVLIIQAAGNDNQNLDVEPNFPNRRYIGGGSAGAYIMVGASGWTDNENLKADFSNYGPTTVDVFAPGEKIYSSVPDSKYASYDGTSMAAPVVAGLAALIRSYYPKLTAVQVKDVIMKSVVKVNHNVNIKSGEILKSVPFKDICVSGGIVNAFNALSLAARYN
ncbi:S8 family peptidase [Pedobacter duraquae]|uniref:Subtilase family protein n=1 Tax=Pedobacter duraquae TaxID=425511 RepID=A0A4R6ID69_9SPHI|nr:S8 family peptidase [Pedobacter duraquae]TDO19616.1 subtilase family protein [Pedobacter duraquae]